MSLKGVCFDLDKAIILAFSFVLLLVLGMQIILFSLPYFQRIGFDATCHRALLKMEQAGGLTSDIKRSLESDLKAQNFTGIDIHGSYNVAYGQEMLLNVHVHLTTRRISPLLMMEVTNRVFTYENIILSRYLSATEGGA